MKNIKYLLNGIRVFFIVAILSPILFSLMIIDLLFIFGGCDPFNTPITPIREWIDDKLL